MARSFFEAECRKRGIADWETQFSRVSHGLHRDPFRRLLAALGIQVWVELTIGHSFHAYCGLDAYKRFMVAHSPPPEYEAHFLLNTEKPVSAREITCPEDWWRYQFWQSFGQQKGFDDWEVSVDTRGSGDQSIVSTIPRMATRTRLQSLFADPMVVFGVLRSMKTDQERARFMRMIKQIDPDHGSLLEGRMLENSKL